MKTTKNILLLSFLIIAAISCENDFAPVGSDIVGGDNFSGSSESYAITTYNQPLPPVQTNNLPSYLLGHFNDPTYGGTSASFLSQMAPTQFDPEFPGNLRLDSVILTLPYFSRAISVDELGNTTYEIDSIFGNSPIRLSVFQNNFFLRDFDPNPDSDGVQNYFSNASTSSSNFIPQSQLENLLLVDTTLTPNLDEINLTEIRFNNQSFTQDTILSQRLAPALRLKLDNPGGSFWEDLIFEKQGEFELSNANNFNNHFRGLYIKAEPTIINSDGSLFMFDISLQASNVTLFFSSPPTNINNPERETGSFTLMFSGNSINIFENNFNLSLPQGNSDTGDEQLFLKGGEGSMAIINLFNGDENGNSPEFEAFKNDFIQNDTLKRVVNEAFIEFTVDQTQVNGNQEPNRIYVYDIENNIPLVDFFLDQSTATNGSQVRNNHLRPLVRENNSTNGKGQTYRIRITEHINNLILRDSTNVKLGLVVASDLNTTSVLNRDIQAQNNALNVSNVPITSILSPRGTVLIGNNTTDDARRVRFRVFFTEPDENNN